MRRRAKGSKRSAVILAAIVLGVGAWLSSVRDGLAHCRDGTPACPDVIIQGTTITIMDPTHTTVITLTNQSPGVVLPLPPPTQTPLLTDPLALSRPPSLAPPPEGRPTRPGQLVDVPPPALLPLESALPAPQDLPEGMPSPPAHLPAFEVDRGQPASGGPRSAPALPPVALVPLDPKGAPIEPPPSTP